ncbi:MAG TPA: biopolymer transporter ExbD [Pirellulaceae bacterium]|nr:biopolymer transporter ExbD [Pirellulaceae bacterium]
MRFHRKKKEIMEADLTPMIDMTFQLIAFFMIIINFSEVDRAEEIMLPTSRIAKPPEVLPDYRVILNLNEDGSLIFDGQRVERIEFIGSLLRREVSAAARVRVKPGDVSVIIRGHQETPTGLVQRLMAKCQEHELESFSLRVKEER